ncbi:gamma-glutamylcyclotransferase [Paracoccus liaowanqingii]|uniref:glutathione-specific gamma-glutamylcyclotransferase n=1 Tax=Paracoccus liaowanqingii TaxID=2560053 RepID=A0A4P7HLG0_9RHOB|nr:gamma-glutamylcyclotransferase [Paracoccus liaowanqingii]QBX34995.1 gamma-glutamylcyclotransferase [Paracoccus liaowanqingii]TGN54392.1 gamma-glutamylcyclotransferase [Paracoccus liaowanqingii]
MPQPVPLVLSDHHVARVAPAEGLIYDPAWRLLDEVDLDALADRLTRGRPRPIPIFAYGSLIWNPGFAVQDRRRATAIGWHRDFSLSLEHFRGTPERPGLMLALASGGSCEGLVMDIAPGTEVDSLRAILKRELVAHELAANACWIEVETARGREEALTFYADPVDTPVARLTLPQQARRLASAAGAAGSGAEYLLRTARGLAELGIHDDYIWTLQQLVAEEIEATLPAGDGSGHPG